MAPMALASDGSLLLNIAEFQDETSPDALLRAAQATGLVVFVGVIVPANRRKTLLHYLDDAVAEVAGRIGAKLTAESASASSPSSGAPGPAHQDPRGRRAPHPRGRRP